MGCNKININTKSIVCTGDLRYPITIYMRSIKTPQNVDFGFDLSNFKVVKAGVNIVGDTSNVGGSNINDNSTHIFYIRYDADASNAYLIKYIDKYYNVVSIQDVDFRRNFLRLNTTETGTTNNEVNLV